MRLLSVWRECNCKKYPNVFFIQAWYKKELVKYSGGLVLRFGQIPTAKIDKDEIRVPVELPRTCTDIMYHLLVKVCFNAISTGLISTIILSPICEELTFRGVFVSRLKLIVPTVFAVLVSSLLFASLHGFGSVISAFVFGICMAIVYLKTDNIFVPILAHFLNNVFAEAIVLLDGNHIFFTNSSLMCIMSVMAAVSFVLISVFIVREMKILNNNNL